MGRGQLPLSVLEVAIGVVVILSVTLGFALGPPAADTRGPQLDAYASDVATVLANEQPRHGGSTRLREVLASEATFDRERGALERRVERILPENVLFRVETPHGTVGLARPRQTTTGTAVIPTGIGRVRIEVWYA
ncbi:hypothetical protein ACFQL1_13845 [Halomicroarcula sp. GCM10025709]|uniref:DUF7262 family protein n=1 Tax=Haloarcula TaxID=2237 RepID=UPI0024C364A2|nr:hypothetical protein [Halomicroarcula sp. YJ-61-S]